MCVVAAILCIAAAVHALPAEHYAANSVLAEGRWAKVKVASTGMQLITNSQLKTLGFTDPSKVNVYGTGGQMVSEIITETPDDLPLLPCVRTTKGILFFGVDNAQWIYRDGQMSHTLNPYCSESYYFISDRAVEVPETKKSNATADVNGDALTSFTSRLYYEQDQINPVGYGRRLLGEDFRTQKNRTFKFTMPDKVGLDVEARVCFAAKTVNGSSSLVLKANDKTLPATSENVIPGVSGDNFYNVTTIRNTFEHDSESLSLEVNYNYSGVIYHARLDYIEVFYDRKLALRDGELHFYGDFSGSGLELSGCPDDVVVWDVTQPWAPALVEYARDGDKVRFTAPKGYREYVAFDSSKAGKSVTTVSGNYNQNIHAMPSPDMLIVAYPQYKAAAERIANVHRTKDEMEVVVLSPQEIYNEFSGGHADIGAFRKLLKMWYDRDDERKISHCLLLGRGSYDSKMVSPNVKSAKYVPLPLWQSEEGLSEAESYSTDDIIGMIDDETAQTFDISRSQIRVAVGRLPVTSAAEANNAAAKIEKYVNNPEYGSWRNRVMLIADDQDGNAHLTQTEDVYTQLSTNAPHYRYEKVYLDTYELKSTGVGLTYPDAKQRVLRTWNEGVGYTNYIGHASPNSWTHEKLLTWTDMVNINNTNLTFLCAATCSFGHWDGDEVSGAEVMTLNPNYGFIGAITPSRTVYIGLNGPLNISFSNYFLTDAEDGRNYTVGQAFIKGKNAIYEKNKLRYCLISDPALRIPKPGKRIMIESFDAVTLDEQSDDELMVLPAGSKVNVKGKVCNSDGSVVDNFSGVIQLDLYDAERVVETLGNGKEGEATFFNDRTVKLSSVSAKVEAGVWSATLFVPTEIGNNYSPAKLLAYGWTKDGNEAQGSTEKFYVYGEQEGASTDTKGPEFDYLYLNFPGQEDGCSVNATPVLHAAFSDESGINLSDAGIGHKMTINVDGNKIYDDVDSFYSPDPERAEAGYVSYPLDELMPGEHTLTFTVYDNANNSSKKSLSFNVATTRDPLIRDLTTDVNPASVSVEFSMGVDAPNSSMKCRIEVFDLMGKRVWQSEETKLVDMQGNLSKRWDLCDSAGRRVPRGIYLYRATVETSEGRYSSQTKKLAVTAP